MMGEDRATVWRRLGIGVRHALNAITGRGRSSSEGGAPTESARGMKSSGGDGRGEGHGGISRRRLLYLGGASVLGVVISRVRNSIPGLGSGSDHHHDTGPRAAGSSSPKDVVTTEPKPRVLGETFARWSDAATWKGKVPGTGDVAQIDLPVLLDVDADVAGLVVGKNGVLVFDALASRTLTSKGNVIVRGKLVMRPATPDVVHLISITGANEAAFMGGHAEPLDTDTGLWTVEGGVLDAVGSAKRGWIRAAGSIVKGAPQVTLAETPSGWRVGDEIVITPTAPPTTKNNFASYDSRTIKAISGKTITLSHAASYDHPLVTVAPGKSYTAEVLNLTRNVRVEGKPGHRIHVFFNSTKKQTVRYLAVRYAGPRQGTDGVLGRYGLHFHMVGDYSRGSLVEGCVVREAGHHGFVPHASNGVTFRDCVTHDTMSAAYWWDPGPGNATKDAFFDRCVASYLHTDGNDYRLSAFWLGHGEGNTAHGCVGVGVVGGKNSSGFQWPESPGPRTDGTVWDFKDCVSHNNKANGIFVWQNNSGPSVIDRFVAYHNAKSGIEHGAYKNDYRYQNSILYGNGQAGAFVWAVSGGQAPLSFVNVLFDGAGHNDYAISFQRHSAPPSQTTKVTGCTFKGYKVAAFGLTDNSALNPDTVDVVNCTFGANQFYLGNQIDKSTVLRVQDPKLGTIALRRFDQPGTYHPAWNARVTSISKFS